MKPKYIWSALLVMLVLFATVSIRSEMGRGKAGEPGKLSGRAVEAETQTVETIEEAPVPVVDQTAPDPMLLAPAAREQYLHSDGGRAPARPVEYVAESRAEAWPTTSSRTGKSRFTVVGGPEGVTLIDTQPRRQ